jgi:hypothetical protein
MLAARTLDRPFMQLTLTLNRGELGIFVRDYCPGTPRSAKAGAEDEHGRGLLLVEAISDRSGWYPANDDHAPGKVVWAALSS